MAVTGYRIGQGDLVHSMEIGFAITVQESVREGHWLAPTQNGKVRFIKPPLPFWIAQAAAWLVDRDHASMLVLRGCSAAMGLSTAICVYLLGRRLFDRRVALWSALAWATCHMSVVEMRLARHDIYLTAAVALAMLGVWAAWRKRRWGWVVAAVGLTLAFQVKGPVSWLLTLAPFTAFVLMTDRRRWRMLAGLWAIGLLGGLTLLPWVRHVQRITPADLSEAYAWEAVGRVASDKVPLGSPLYYLQFPYYLAPWSVLLIGGLALPFVHRATGQRQPLLFCFLWLVGGLFLLSLPKEKTHRYAVPLIAPAALLVGRTFVQAANARACDGARQERALLYAHAALLLVAAVGLPLVVAAAGLIRWPQAAIAGLVLAPLGLGSAGLILAGRIRAGVVLTLPLALALNGVWTWTYETAPRFRQPWRAMIEPARAAVGDAQVVAWPEARSPRVFIYHLNRVIPALPDPDVAGPLLGIDRQSAIERLRADPAGTLDEVLAAQLRSMLGRPLVIFTTAPALDRLRAVAADAGYAAGVALEMTPATDRGRPVDGDRPWLLVRCEPTGRGLR